VRVLRIGDPHVKPTNIEECHELFKFVTKVILDKKPDRVELLGDLFHTHAILRLEVLEFWKLWLDKLSDLKEVFVIAGNHDQTGDHHLDTNALSIFKLMKKDTLHIIDSPKRYGIFAYAPYEHDHNVFIDTTNDLAGKGAKVLVCHQTFTGSKYESGVYAPDGMDASVLNYDLIISGHIHSRQRFGNVIYPGTAYWQSNSDVNESKGLWLVEHDGSGNIQYEEFIDTSNVCKPIVGLTWTEGEEAPTIPENARVSIKLVGSSDWVVKNKKLLKGQVSVSTKITDKVNKEARQTGGNFHDFVSNLFITKVDRKELLQYMKEKDLG
jgi:DNA repair exonuclease SbcCD nuclease subunit